MTTCESKTIWNKNHSSQNERKRELL